VGTLLDSYAVVALLAEEEAAETVALIVQTREAAITAANLAECVDVLERREPQHAQVARAALESLLAGGLTVVALTEAHAFRAGSLRARHFTRRNRPLSLADCFLLAAATPEDRLATNDELVLEVAAAEGIATLALP
jgi:uncharacterized protein with PIN domain